MSSQVLSPTLARPAPWSKPSPSAVSPNPSRPAPGGARTSCAGRDVLVKSPTGSGKTLAFAVPLVEIASSPTDPRPSALVLAPTRELACQIDRGRSCPLAQARALSVAAVYGGAGIQPQIKLAAPRPHPRGDPRPPGGPDRARRAVKLEQVRMLVLDEADRMLDMGFKPAVDRIVGRGAARSPDALLLRDPRRRGRAARARLHPQRRAATSTRPRASGAAT